MAPAVKVEKKFSKSEEKSIKQFYIQECTFAKELLKDVPRPKNDEDEEEEEEEEHNRTKPDRKPLPKRLCPALGADKKPARTVEELQTRLALLKGQSKLSYKQKLAKKSLKDKLRKKDKKEKRKRMKESNKNKTKAEKLNPNEKKNVKGVSPVYNAEGKMIFSKFDFSGIGAKESKNPHVIKDPAFSLTKIEKEEEKFKTLKEAGKGEVVREMKQKKAWKAALLKSEGVPIKDDPELLQKTLKKQKYKKEKSVKKWQAREAKLKKDQEERQKKRLENIKGRARQKKLGKMKKASKRGRVVAGF